MSTATHITHSTLRQQAVAHKTGQRMLPHYLPPEGRPGQGGPDAHTELQGFHRDYDRVLQAVLAKYPQGGERQEIGRTLTQLAAVQPPHSCGPYLRATMLELRDVVAPDYLRNIAQSRLAAPEAAQNLAALQGGRPVDGAETVLADLRADLARRSETRPDLTARLNNLADDYARTGDDYMAETAAILAARSRDFLASTHQQQVATAVAALQSQEALHDFSQTIDYSPQPPHPSAGVATATAQHRPRR